MQQCNDIEHKPDLEHCQHKTPDISPLGGGGGGLWDLCREYIGKYGPELNDTTLYWSLQFLLLKRNVLVTNKIAVLHLYSGIPKPRDTHSFYIICKCQHYVDVLSRVRQCTSYNNIVGWHWYVNYASKWQMTTRDNYTKMRTGLCSSYL